MNLGQIVFSQITDTLESKELSRCVERFPWAKFRSTKSAIKMHAMIDLRGSTPSLIAITEGRIHDVNALDWIAFEVGAFYVMDRGYVDFRRLGRILRPEKRSDDSGRRRKGSLGLPMHQC